LQRAGMNGERWQCLQIVQAMLSFGMAQITIRKLDDKIVKQLRLRAAEAGHSMEEEARRVLASGVGADRAKLVAALTEFQRKIGKRKDAPAEKLIRNMRDSRPAADQARRR
jgi:plasmid stability protein